MKHINIIESFYPSLSKKEKIIANYMYEKKEIIINQSLYEISIHLGLCMATIVRFIKKIGYKGFYDFKIQVAQEKPNLIKTKHDNFIDGIEFKILDVISNTKLLLNMKHLNESIDLLIKSERVFIYGVGDCGLTALEMEENLLELGKSSIAFTDKQTQLINSSIVNEQDLIIAISLSGVTPEIIDAIKLAKKNGSKVISITNYSMSTIAKLSDKFLLTKGGNLPLGEGLLISKISQLYIIEILCKGYALKKLI